MKIAHQSDAEWEVVSRHRDTSIEFKRLLKGEEGKPDNYELSLVRFVGQYTTPRHRHNYDQVRYSITGEINYAKGKVVPEGGIGYFPEGTYYGPQDIPAGGLTMGLQFGGASGQGMMSYDQLRQGSKELSEMGGFKSGVYSAPDREPKRKKKDGYEALWEHVSGKPLIYPAARFEEPVVMHPDAFAWTRREAAGVQKSLGRFGERGVAIDLIGFDNSDTQLAAQPNRMLYFVMSGTANINGQIAAQHDAFVLEPGEVTDLAASGFCILMQIVLPPVPHLVRFGQVRASSQAA